MRLFLANIIAIFAKLVTFGLSPMRRRDARIVARDLLSANYPIGTDRGQIVFDANTRYGFRAAWNFVNTDADTLAWLISLPEEGCYWDIGANAGVYCLFAALRPNLRVIAFEPSANSYALLNRNIEINQLSDRISAYCIAFAKETKLDVLNMARTDAGLSMHGFGTEVNQYDTLIDTKFRQGAVGYSIDDFAKTFSPSMPTHVKVDVDGIEADIIRGGRETLSVDTLQSMMVEIEGNLESARNQELFELMRELGFKPRPKTSPNFSNVIFYRTTF